MTCHCQQGELYRAESTVAQGRRFGSVEELQAWVDNLRDTIWWQRFYARVVRVEVGASGKARKSVGGWYPEQNAGRMEMAVEHMTELYALHELTHVLADVRYGSHAHDPWFARVYLELVFLVMGREPWHALHDAFHAGGVEHDPPRRDFELGRARWEM